MATHVRDVNSVEQTSSLGNYDVAVIGGGVVGCAVLRAAVLAGLRCVMLERGTDILSGASKANSAILHTGFDAPPGSLEVALMQRGRAIYLAIREELGLPLLETDAVLVAWSEVEASRLKAIADKAKKNGVNGLVELAGDALASRHPTLDRSAVAALEVPGEHIIDPWSAPLAYVQHAIANGATVLRKTPVQAAGRRGTGWLLTTPSGAVEAAIVINCAGNFGDKIDALAGRYGFSIRPRKGQFVVLDKSARRHVPTIILPVPTERTKGVVICPTIFGNVLIGPTAEDQDDREDVSTDAGTLRHLLKEGARMVPALGSEPMTAAYAGLRPASDRSDYILERDGSWITVAGIRSTGLTAALGIAEHVVGMIGDLRAIVPLDHPLPVKVANLAEHLPRDHQRPGRGEILCLCELVTRDEIEAALNGPLPALDLSGVKRRTRAMLGRCQGFNCLAAVCEAGGPDFVPSHRETPING